MVQRADAAGQHGLRVLEVSEGLAGSNTVVGVNYPFPPPLPRPFFSADSGDTQRADHEQSEQSADRAIFISPENHY